jgi:hypothetical protein
MQINMGKENLGKLHIFSGRPQSTYSAEQEKAKANRLIVNSTELTTARQLSNFAKGVGIMSFGYAGCW